MSIYDKPTANIILNGEKLKVFPLRSETRQGCPPSPLLFNIVLEILATAIWEGNEAKGTHIGKGIKLCRQMTWYYTYKIQRCYQKTAAAAAAAKSLQSCSTLCSPPGFPVPGILQEKVLEWGAIALLELNKFGKVADYKINTQKSVVFLNTNRKTRKNNSRSNSIYHHIKKNKNK